MKARTRLRGWLHRLDSSFERTFRSYDSQDLLDALRSTGVVQGDVLLVHSSMDQLSGFRGSASDVIDVLKRVVGRDGTLMMPTMPFTGTALDYVRSGSLFDVRRTPSRMGLISELFRRGPDVVRSAHPTHPVAAWGRLAEEVIRFHSQSMTPCDDQSPFGALLRLHGKTLLLGVDIGTYTFFHTIEAQLEQRMPFSPFTEEEFRITYKDTDGRERSICTRLFDPVVSRRRTIERLVPELKKMKAWNEARVGRLRLVVIPAAASLNAASFLADHGIFCYE